MADLNMCIFTGRLGRDPEVRYMPNGDAAVNISIAVGKTWKDKNTGEKKEQTTWVPISYFGKTAQLEFTIAEAMVLTGWAQTPLELMEQGEAWLAELILKNQADAV